MTSWADGFAAGIDQTVLRRHNLSLLLRHLRDSGERSRAKMAAETGLNKATVSSLVTELVERGLVREGAVERGSVGRPGHALELDGSAVCGVGAEISGGEVASMALDLRGEVVSERRRQVETSAMDPLEVIDQLSVLLAETMDEISARGAQSVGITLGVPGLVNTDTGVVTVHWTSGWRELPVARLLAERLGGPPGRIQIDNAANLAATAEAGAGESPDRRDLLVLVGHCGVDAGIVAGGQLLRGRHGFAGEVGHLRLAQDGPRCGCGRIGCWETLVGLRALMTSAADPDDPVQDPAVPLEQRLDEVNRRATLGDARTQRALHQVGTHLGTGAAMMIDVLDSGLVVLGGYFAAVGQWLLEPMQRELDAAAVTAGAGRCRVELSRHGFRATVHGGALVALETIFNDPTVVRKSPSVPVAQQIGGIR